MNYEALWKGRKRTLVDQILAGKKADVKMKDNGYDVESYGISAKGEKAQDELVEMVLAEVTQYDAEHMPELSINPARIKQGIILTDCKNESEN